MNIQYENNSSIEAGFISLGRDFQIGSNVQIKVRGKFDVGNFARFGNNVTINAEEVIIGNHFYHYTDGLRIGGGGSQFPDARIVIGDRCVLHNNYINLAQSVYIGSDVGLSPDVDILTHGFWQSVFEGYPTKYARVNLGEGVIVGQRSMILPGVSVRNNIVIGAQSVVTKDLTEENSIYAGNPAKFIKKIIPLDYFQKRQKLHEIIGRYNYLSKNDAISNYPYVEIPGVCKIHVDKKTLEGTENEATDKLRDYLRRYGIRIYTERPFLSL